MPQTCSYQRRHSVLAHFNLSTNIVTFTIRETTSDYLKCIYQGTTLTGSPQRCTGVSAARETVAIAFHNCAGRIRRGAATRNSTTS